MNESCRNNELRLNNITAGYNKIKIIDKISFTIPAGSKIALIGSNGAGKSTLVKAINGLLPVSSGQIFWGDESIETMKSSLRTGVGIATVPEGRLLFPDCSVLENLMAATTFKRAKADRINTLDRVIGLFPRLEERSSQLVGTLSGGEQQMVAIGRALMTQPQLLILDEPSIGLAPRVIGEIFQALDVLAKTGLSILLVEQNVELSLRFVDYAYVLQQGVITLSGKASDLANNPLVRAAYLGQ